MVDVFISYSRANQDVVRRLAEAVKRVGYTVWWDDELPPHRSYSEVITEKIAVAKAAIVVWSGGSIGSEWVRAEADLARNQKKLIQTALDDCMPPMPFNQIQFASLAGWDGEDDHPGWNKVKGSLSALCGAGTDIRTAFPMPDRAPPAAMATAATLPPQPAAPQRRSGLMLGVVIGGALAVLAVVGVLALSRDRDPPVTNQAAAQPAASTAPSLSRSEPEPAKPTAPPPQAAAQATPAVAAPQAARPRPTTVRQPLRPPQTQPQRQQQAAMPMRPRRYCMGPGRGTPECQQMRRQRMGY